MHSTILVLSEDIDFEVDVETLNNDADISKVVDYIGEKYPIEEEIVWIKKSYSNILNVGIATQLLSYNSLFPDLASLPKGWFFSNKYYFGQGFYCLTHNNSLTLNPNF